MSKEAILVLADIVQTEMELTDDQVVIYNQKFDIPDTAGLFIVLSFVSIKTYATKTIQEDRENDGFYEVQRSNHFAVIGIDIYSKNDEARTRKEEIISALKSTFAQQEMESNSIKIFTIPSDFADVSFIEAAALLNRFHGDISVLYSTVKEKKIDYYDTFPPAQTELNI